MGAPAPATVDLDHPMEKMVTVASAPEEIRSRDYQPITDPKNVERFIEDYFADIPILKRVAFCESSFRHLNKDGSVRRGIKNRFDVGVMQVNTLYHEKEAKALGLDLMSLDGNVAFARHLYEREGVRPWNSSGKCWNTDLAINR